MAYLPNEPVDREEHVHVEQTPSGEVQQRVIADTGAERPSNVARVASLVWLLFGILEALIAIRVVLKLIAANPANAFAQIVYGLTEPFLLPFIGLTGTPQAGGMVLEIPALIAMIVYALIGWVLVKLIWLLFYRPSTRSVTTYNRDRI
jgi:uncharacterized protein YggT (Ycf19 family)